MLNDWHNTSTEFMSPGAKYQGFALNIKRLFSSCTSQHQELRVDTDPIILQRKQEYLSNIERDPDSDVTRHLERMVDALQYCPRKAREFVRKNRWTVFGGAIFLAVILKAIRVVRIRSTSNHVVSSFWKTSPEQAIAWLEQRQLLLPCVGGFKVSP